MIDLLEKIKARLSDGAFPNEAAVSHGVLVPLLQSLGWDPAEPDQIMPEYSSGRGRVDFALCTHPRRPAVFIEVKGVGRSLEGDKQLFEYAFHEGVPICVLTDGREWSFYLPSGQGSYDDRRVYKLQLDDRSPSESEAALTRYLGKDRVRSGAALEAATADYRSASAKRDANRSLPEAWAQLVAGPEELLVELLADQCESISGYRPNSADIVDFLSGLSRDQSGANMRTFGTNAAVPAPISRTRTIPSSSLDRSVSFAFLGESHSAKNGNAALLDVLSLLARRDLTLVPQLAMAVRGNTRNHIAQTVEEIYPARPDLARANEFTPGWLVGTNIANREKVRIVQRACEIYGLSFGRDIKFSLPNG